MSKSSLRILAVLLTAGIIAVLFAGLDSLPGAVKAQIAAEHKSFSAAESQVQAAQADVSRTLASESALFGALPSAREYPDRLGRAASSLAAAGQSLAELERLEKQNRRSDRARAEALLAQEKQVRAAAVGDAESVRTDAAHWVDLKQHLPQEVRDMERDYQAIHAVDLAAAAAAAQKAEADWPQKKNDLESRLTTARGIQTRSDELWQSTTEVRRAAAANDYSKVDFGTLFAAADTLKTGASDLPKQTEQLKSLSAQLYQSWDKILVDMETRGSGNAQGRQHDIRRKMGGRFEGAIPGHGEGPGHGDRTQARREVRHRKRARGPAGRLRLHGPARTEQPVRPLGAEQRHQLLGLLRPVRADARPAVQSQLPSAGIPRISRLLQLPPAQRDLLRP